MKRLGVGSGFGYTYRLEGFFLLVTFAHYNGACAYDNILNFVPSSKMVARLFALGNHERRTKTKYNSIKL